MTKEQKQKMIDKVIHGFNFEKVRALMLVMDWTWAGQGVPTEQKLWDEARKLCEKVMEHDDRECWWATTGGLLAYFDKKNGLHLAFIPERARAIIKEGCCMDNERKINSLWHDAEKEMPKEGTKVLIESIGRNFYLCDVSGGNVLGSRGYIWNMEIKRWLDVNDLL